MGRSGCRSVSPGPGCPRGAGQLSWRTADAPRALELGASVPRLAALPSGRRVGSAGLRRGWRARGRAGRRQSPPAGQCVGRGLCLWGRLLSISLLFANGRGGSFRLFPLAQLGRDTAGRSCPASWGAGRARERGQGLVYRSAPERSGGTCVQARGARHLPPPSRRPLTAQLQPRPPLPLSRSPGGRRTVRSPPPAADTARSRPAPPPPPRARAAGKVGGARRGAWLRLPFPGPPPSSPPAANRRGGKCSCR